MEVLMVIPLTKIAQIALQQLRDITARDPLDLLQSALIDSQSEVARAPRDDSNMRRLVAMIGTYGSDDNLGTPAADQLTFEVETISARALNSVSERLNLDTATAVAMALVRECQRQGFDIDQLFRSRGEPKKEDGRD